MCCQVGYLYKYSSVKWVKVAHWCLTLCNPMDYRVHRIVQTRVLEWVASLSLLQGIFPTQGLQANSLPTEPQGKPKNTGVGSLSLLQQIFPTQKSNQGLLYCKQILYQLNCQGSPILCE